MIGNNLFADNDFLSSNLVATFSTILSVEDHPNQVIVDGESVHQGWLEHLSPRRGLSLRIA